MSVDNVTALEARDSLLWVVHHWPDLRTRLRPSRGNAQIGVISGTTQRPIPIDVHVSDLMRDIENGARFYGQILDAESDDQPITTSAMPGLLEQVARRYGHFTAGDDAMALGFCDDAHQYRDKVRRVLERPAPPTYLGPCQRDNCSGDIYIRQHRDAGTCPECGHSVSVLEQKAWLDEQMQDRLMTPTELGRALKFLGYNIATATVRKWIERDKLVEVGDGLYRLIDAERLARQRKVA